MAGETTCDSPTLEGCLPFTCADVGTNYDAENVFGALFDNRLANPTSRHRATAELHGIHAGSCFAHVTQTVESDPTHHAWFDEAAASQTGADGETWFRYEIPVPRTYLGRTIDLSLWVDHLQGFGGVGRTGIFVDDISIIGGCVDDAQCDDRLFCTGAEVCNAGTCESLGDPCALNGECADNCDEVANDCFADEGQRCGVGLTRPICNPDICDDAGNCTDVAWAGNGTPCGRGIVEQTCDPDACRNGECVDSAEATEGTLCSENGNTCCGVPRSCRIEIQPGSCL